MKLMLINILMVILLTLVNFNWFDTQNFYLYNSYSNFLMNKSYSLTSGNITLLTNIYLLFTLIIVSNIISIFNHPLRMS